MKKDQEYFKILLSGRNVWNKWREDNSDIIINFQGRNLSKMNLLGFNLRGINFDKADFKDSVLDKAKLQNASLKEAVLNHAQVNEANLEGADLSFADFRGADSDGTNFSKAILTGIKIWLWGADNAKFNDIKCDYIFYEPNGRERYPKKGNFKEGEFEKYFLSGK